MLNTYALSKTELKRRIAFRCVHRHNGLRHPQCYDQANNLTERIGYFDLECSNLNANWGIIISYAILAEDGELVTQLITEKDILSGNFDKRVCEKFCEDARKFDRLIGWYSERFDAPYARTRCLYHNIDFPLYKEIKHTDAWKVCRKKLKLHSNRLGVVAPFFGIKAKEHPLNPDIWLKALSANSEAQDARKFIMTHNIEDVESLKKVWHRLENFAPANKDSL